MENYDVKARRSGRNITKRFLFEASRLRSDQSHRAGKMPFWNALSNPHAVPFYALVLYGSFSKYAIFLYISYWAESWFQRVSSFKFIKFNEVHRSSPKFNEIHRSSSKFTEVRRSSIKRTPKFKPITPWFLLGKWQYTLKQSFVLKMRQTALLFKECDVTFVKMWIVSRKLEYHVTFVWTWIEAQRLQAYPSQV